MAIARRCVGIGLICHTRYLRWHWHLRAMRKLEIHVLGKKVQEKLSRGEDIIIDDTSDIPSLKQLFNKELVQYQHHSEVGQQRMTEIPVFQLWLEEAKQTLYKRFM